MKLASHLTLLKNFSLRSSLIDKNRKFTVKWVNFEFSSGCNLRCKWCSLDHSKPWEFMSPEILAKVLDELSKSKEFDLERIDLHNAGEILLHKNLEEMLRVIANRKVYFKNTTIATLTNATLLTPDVSRILIDSCALDEIQFSVDGGTKQLYEDIRGGAKWEQVQANITSFIELNNNSTSTMNRTRVICIIPAERDKSTEWMEDDFKKLFSKIDVVELRYAHNWDGSASLGVEFNEQTRKHFEEIDKTKCLFLDRNLVVLPNGNVTLCCADLNSRGIIGNVNDHTMEQLYFSKKRIETIKLFKKGDKHKIELCKHCTGY